MKSIIRNITTALLLTATHGSFAQSTPSSDEPSTPSTTITLSYYDYHNHNRAIAYGSLLLNPMIAANTWKAVDAYQFYSCEESSSSGTTNPPQPTGSCQSIFDVLITTRYEFLECDDGKAMVARYGKGVTLTSKTTGDFFEWSYNDQCDDDPIGLREKFDNATITPMDHKKLVKVYQP